MAGVSVQATKKANTQSVIFMQKAAATEADKKNAILKYENYITEMQTSSQNFEEQDKAKLQAKLFKITNKLNEIKCMSEQYIDLITERYVELKREKELLEEHSQDLNEQNKQSIEELDEIEDELKTTTEKLKMKEKELTDYRDHSLQQRLNRSNEHEKDVTWYIYFAIFTNIYTCLFSNYGFQEIIDGHFGIIYYLFEITIYMFLTTVQSVSNTTDFLLSNLVA